MGDNNKNMEDFRKMLNDGMKLLNFFRTFFFILIINFHYSNYNLAYSVMKKDDNSTRRQFTMEKIDILNHQSYAHPESFKRTLESPAIQRIVPILKGYVDNLKKMEDKK